MPSFGRALALLALLATSGCASRAEPPAAPSRPQPPAVWTPPPASSADARVAAAIAFAEAQVGKRYCWGGTGPSCFDCSGLVQAAWRWGGVKLPRTTGQQARVLQEVPTSSMMPGDILWWSHGHVGLYIGGGAIIDAYHSGAGVVLRRAPRPERVLRVVPPPLAYAQGL